ncbi:unnamed protein product [Owenia fusiformis]|uniref:Uncharacterized protein n=1 Tax=Owenia fusiformis TaxID=6347 RepID=A0A8J1TRG0_OWEFU|nr:unnamed protein product [Owenia fusiformis]
MMKHLLCLGLALVLAQGAPTNPEEGDMFEGDILLEDDQDIYNAIRNSAQMWPNGVVPYTVSVSMTSTEQANLNAAIADYSRHTCIKWVPRTNQQAYVNIIKGGGCYSNVGTLRRVQTLSLGRGCWSKGIIIHEMMHAVGFFHEQSRSDRDNYVTIMLQNVRPGMEHNFNKYPSSQVNDLLTYDYGSVMHYQAGAFSKNGQPTIVAKTPGTRLGQRAGFSQLDIRKINMLYKCSGGGGGGGVTPRPTPRPTIRPTTRRFTTPRVTPGGSCTDRSVNCNYYRSIGRCNIAYYKSLCPRSCSNCGGVVTQRPTPRPTTPRPTGCQDKYTNCGWFKSNGYCDRPNNRDYYRGICPKSCGVCGVTTPRPTPPPVNCKDKFSNCPSFKSMGYCDRVQNKDYFRSICPLSCGVCGGVTPRPTVRPTTGPRNSQCGVSKLGHDSFIVGGQEARVGRWPWMADLLSNGRHICGGSILNANWILTAAHCVRGKTASSLQIRVGEHDQRKKTVNGVTHSVLRVIGHTGYNPSSRISHDNDIALLKLSKPIDMTNTHVNTICLPQKGEQFSGQCVATGWGMTQGTGDMTKLREVTVPVYTTSDCNRHWGGRVSDRQICMGTVPPAPTKTACRGDSGGPLVCKKNGRWVQSGVTSWGTFQCTGKPAVYTRTSEYLDWINANMR